MPSQLLILVIETELHASNDGVTFTVMDHCLTIQSIIRLHWGYRNTEKTLTTERNGVVYNLRSQCCGGGGRRVMNSKLALNIW